jgi:hypothetical protein
VRDTMMALMRVEILHPEAALSTARNVLQMADLGGVSQEMGRRRLEILWTERMILDLDALGLDASECRKWLGLLNTIYKLFQTHVDHAILAEHIPSKGGTRVYN